MKLSHFIIVLITLVLAICIPYAYSSSMVDTQIEENRTIEKNLATSCADAMKSVDTGNTYFFSSESIRNSVVDNFYSNICRDFNYISESKKEEAKFHVPCLVMTDWDGYYLHYVKQYKDASSETAYKEFTTDLNTWNETYGGKYTIRYYLNDVINVTEIETGKSVFGKPSDVYEKLGNPAVLDFLKNTNKFDNERNVTIVGNINEQLDYYVGTHNSSMNRKESSYMISLPHDNNTRNARMLKAPALFAFWQGNQTQVREGYINTFAFATAEVTANDIYYVSKDTDGKLYYHQAGCSKLTEYLFSGSMEQCAGKGANPCDCVNN